MLKLIQRTNRSNFSRISKFKLFFKMWGPYVGAGIQLGKVNSDLREVVTVLRQTWYNRTFIGSHYGGNLFSMTDPFYVLMLMKNLGPQYLVWDRTATINYIKPGKGEVFAKFELTEEKIREIVEQTKSGEPHFAKFVVDVVDSADGSLVAKVDKVVYIRKKERQ